MLKKDPNQPPKLKPMKVKTTVDIQKGPGLWVKFTTFLKKIAQPTRQRDNF